MPPATPLHPTPTETLWRKAVLVLDDDPACRRTICAIADSVGWASLAAGSFDEAEILIGRRNVDCVVTDLSVGGVGVVRLFRAMALVHCTVPVVMVSAADPATARAAVSEGFRLGLSVCYPIAKPSGLATLAGRLARIERRLRQGNAECCHGDCF
ncbi:hypothetical protein A33M_2830 [Rhodovulum sp. PH10]|uniref:response regulator n=1 Tax=Rhodovulum sp. PH10 TaxID=1187851 RepID=UPI00027C1D82|nr:response regulator [Rhodovulum sp. PH10]EJW13580.1 hypothetical protein A33M_2830 [Rhodovulum sp. PH10]